MHAADRARMTALAFLATVAGTASVGVAMLARAGVKLCDHHVLGHDALAMAGMPGMPGMTGSLAGAASPAGDGLCPILLVAAALFAALCVGIAALLARRIAVAVAAALRLIAPGANAPWVIARQPVLVPARVRVARRGPSRAPPVRF